MEEGDGVGWVSDSHMRPVGVDSVSIQVLAVSRKERKMKHFRRQGIHRTSPSSLQ